MTKTNSRSYTFLVTITLLLCASILAAARTSSVIFENSFAGTHGTTLQSHVPTKISDNSTVNGSWSIQPVTLDGSIVIDSANRARNNFASNSSEVIFTANYEGYFDLISNTNIEGWAADRDQLNTPISVDLYDGTTLLGTYSASNYRSDVASYLGDNGNHGFLIPTPMSLKDNLPHAVHVKIAGTSTETGYSPREFNSGPSIPFDLMGTEDTASRVILTWTNGVGTVDSSRIERKQGAGAFAEIGSVTTSGTTYTDTTVSLGTYIYRVRNRNAQGDSAYSNEATVVVAPLQAVLNMPSTVYVNESVIIDGSTSTGYAHAKLSDGSDPVTITYSDSPSTQVDRLIAPAHSFSTTGLKTITLTVRDNSGAQATTTATVNIINFPAASSTITITDQGSVAANQTALQTQINNATSWKTIVLIAGVDYGSIFLPALGNMGYVRIVSSALASLPANTRVSPANAVNMPKLSTTSNAVPAIDTAQSSQHFSFEGIEVKATLFTYTLIQLGSGLRTQNAANIPHHFIFDRCYIHHDDGASFIQRGIGLNNDTTSILNSYLAGFVQVGVETQAILGYNGTGNYSIKNNYVEGGSENIMFGGAAATIDGLIIKNIEIRGNYLYKQRAWRNTGSVIKNLFELKTGQQVVVDGNIMENCWADGQYGYAVLFTSRTEAGTQLWISVADVQFTNNIVQHVGGGLSIQLKDADSTSNYPTAAQGHNINIADNLFLDLNFTDGGGSGGRLLLIARSVDVYVNHNTVLNEGSIGTLVGYGQNDPMTGFRFTNNIVSHGDYGFYPDGTGQYEDPGFNLYFPDGVLTKNAIIGSNAGQYPTHPGNYFPATQDAVGYTDLAGGNYRLAPTSPYKNAGTDGKDIGADIDAINAAINPSSSPFTGTPSAVPGIIEAENFDNGGEGIAYHDIDAGNNGATYRSTDVDVRAVNTASNGNDVFNAYPGEWLKYTVNVQTTGIYDVGASVASEVEGGTFHIEVDGTDVTGSLKAPTTGSWYAFQYVGKTGVSLTAGTHVLRLSLDTAGVVGVIADFDTISVTASASKPFTGTPVTVPGAIEAENFDNGGEGIAYHDIDAGNNGAAYRSTDVDVRAINTASNGYVVFNAYPGEWLKYTINVSTAGTYSVGASVASEVEGGTFHIEIDGTDVTGSLKAPTTGSWYVFQPVSKSGVNLSAGTHVLRLVLDTGGAVGVIADFDTININ